MDREKVIADIEEQIAWIQDNDFHKFPGWGHTVFAMKDAIALLNEQQEQIDKLIEESASNAELAEGYAELLKEQEAVEPDTDSEGTCSCGNCGETVGYYPVGCNVPERLCKFCPKCGQAVKWDG